MQFVTHSLRLLIATLLLSSISTPLWAVQSHGNGEGLVSHQLGHILFGVGLLYMLLRLRGIQKGEKGWREFKFFLLGVVLWNIIAFFSHAHHSHILASQYIKSDGCTSAFKAESFVDILYYFSRLDHLVLVPALFFLAIALRKWSMNDKPPGETK
jgi:hypothetical protein